VCATEDAAVLWDQRGSSRAADWREHRSEEVRALLRPASRFSSPDIPAPSREQWTAPPSPVVARTGALHLYATDGHSHHGEDRWRWAALGRMVRSLQPDRVIFGGDHWDNPSLTRHTRGTLYNEGQRALADWQAGNDAFHTFLDACGPAMYTGTITLGNHDMWADREEVNNPHLAGIFGRYFGVFEDAGWEVVPFCTEVEIDGLRYVHCITGDTGRPLGAMYHAAQLMRRRHTSYVVGHSHKFDYRREPGPSGWLTGLVGGCYTDGVAAYAGQSNDHGWWRGVCVLHDVADGDYDLECYSLERIKRLWG